MHKHARPKQRERFSDTQPQSASGTPSRFFERELAGEEAPALQSMQALYQRATQLHMRAPWNDLLEEENLVLFRDPISNEQCFCSVLGSLGEVRMLQTYIGESSYFWFRKVHDGRPVTAGDFFAHQRSVFVQYVPLKELEAPDRELLKVMKHPLAKGTVAPVFRAIRPGYHPWFVTENEVRILTTGIEAVLAVCDLMDKDPDHDPWDIADVYPFVTLDEAKDGRQKYNVSEVDAPRAALQILEPPVSDTKRIQTIIDRKLPVKGTLEVDHFYSLSMIGEKHARKACLRIALAIEAKTAFAFPPELGSPEDSTGGILQRVVLGAIEASGTVPARICVRDREFKSLLTPLARALDFEIAIKKSLPALDFAKSEMQAVLGDSEF
jgi:hypothetical protein